MSFEETALKLQNESKCVLGMMSPDILRAIRASTIKIFKNSVTQSGKIKLNTHIRTLHVQANTTVLGHFFPQIQSVTIDDIECVKSGKNKDMMLLKITAPHGIFWLNVQSNCGGVELELVDVRDNTSTLHAAIEAKYSVESVELPFVILTHIDPYTCTNCNVWKDKMRKCKGCWDNLRFCVRYCGKECQKEHWQLGHKFICGKGA